MSKWKKLFREPMNLVGLTIFTPLILILWTGTIMFIYDMVKYGFH